MGVVTFKLEADEGRLMMGLVKVIRKQKEAQRGAAAWGKTSQFSSKRILGDLKQMALGYASVGAGIALVTKGIQHMGKSWARFHEQRKGRLMEAEPNLRRLAQIAKTPAELSGMIRGAKGVATGKGISLGEAAQFEFGVQSLKRVRERGFFAEAADIGEKPAEFIERIHTLRRAFGARGKKVSDRAVANMLLATAGESKFDIGRLVAGVIGPAKAAAKRGATMPETLAAVGALGEAAGSPEEAGTQIAAFVAAVEKKRVPGRGLLETARNLAERKMPTHRLLKYLGRKEAVAGFRGLMDEQRNIEAMVRLSESARAGTGAKQDRWSRAVNLARSNRELQSALDFRRSRELGKTEGAERKLAIETGVNRLAARIRGDQSDPGLLNMGRTLWAGSVEQMGSWEFMQLLMDAFARSPAARDIHQICIAVTGRSPAEIVLPRLGEGGP